MDLQRLAGRGRDYGRGARPTREDRHLAEEVSGVETADVERLAVPAHDEDSHAAGRDDEEAFAGVPLGHDDVSRGEEVGRQATPHGWELIAREVGKESRAQPAAP
jgi:hypothetical protein